MAKEKKDFENIVAPMCRMGCDDLYEKGYIGIKDGHVEILKSEPSTVISDYLEKNESNPCVSWNDQTKDYFLWHVNKHASA